VEIISNNAFRVLGLSVNSNEKDIVSRYDELLALNKIGKVPAFSNDFEWISKPDRSEESLRKAFHILQTPERKIEHMIFWFWEHDEIDKTAISSLSNAHINQAIEIWKQAMDCDENGSISYLKNLATLSFINSLKEFEDNADYAFTIMEVSFEYWGNLNNDKKFWESIGKQMSFHHKPPRLKEELEEYILTTLHKNACPFIKNSLKTDLYNASKYLEFLEESKFSQDKKREVILNFFEPYIEKIESELEKSKKERLSSPENSFFWGNRIKEETKKSLEIINSLLLDEDEISVVINDKIADELFLCAVSYANNTNEWGKAKSLLITAKCFAQGLLLRERIQENIKVLEKRIEDSKIYDLCWFCNKVNGQEENVRKSPMYRTTRIEGSKVFYYTVSVEVPRCKYCKKSHKAERLLVNGFTIIGLVLGIFIGYSVEPQGGFLIGGFFGALIGFGIGYEFGREKDIKSESKVEDFPPIRKLSLEGWKLGKKPPSE